MNEICVKDDFIWYNQLEYIEKDIIFLLRNFLNFINGEAIHRLITPTKGQLCEKHFHVMTNHVEVSTPLTLGNSVSWQWSAVLSRSANTEHVSTTAWETKVLAGNGY